ncbi:MAG: 50S ribosomal protein L10 [Anaerolineaceae bacterium]|nr:50S ribosomal protein L10 [Anaerolineaceae bacterium]
MAFTKQEKKELVSSYVKWLQDSKAAYVMSYHKMSVKDIQELRSEAREIGGELHVVKNTLMNLALEKVNFENNSLFTNEASIVAFAFDDAPSLAKIIDKANSTDMFSIKGGFMNGAPIDVDQIKALARILPMPQMRAQLLALIQTPATQLVRTITEPARQVAAVLKAYSEKNPAPAAG